MTGRLLLFAHGSRDPEWRAPFESLLERLRRELGPERVRLAYMEFVTPSLAQVAAEAVADGVRRLRLLPLFLSSGGHVSRDIPRLADAARRAHPDLDLVVLPPIGLHPAFESLVRCIATASLDESPGEIDAIAPSSNPEPTS